MVTAILTVTVGIMTMAGHTLVRRSLSDFIRLTGIILEAFVTHGAIDMAVDPLRTAVVILDPLRIATIIRDHIRLTIRRAHLDGLSLAVVRGSALPFPLRDP